MKPDYQTLDAFAGICVGLSCADGHADHDEAKVFIRACAEHGVDADAARDAFWRHLASLASGSTPAAALLVQACGAVPRDRSAEALALAVRVMLSDGELHAEELPALVAVRHALGLPEEEYILVVAREVRRSAAGG